MVEETRVPGENQWHIGSLEAYIVILELTTIHSTAKHSLLPLKLDMSDTTMSGLSVRFSLSYINTCMYIESIVSITACSLFWMNVKYNLLKYYFINNDVIFEACQLQKDTKARKSMIISTLQA